MHQEHQYLDLIKDVINNGTVKDDRTKIGTISKFGAMMRFSLRDDFPLLTTKRVFWKGVVEELLFFIKGDTNSKHLEEKSINIWAKNTSREFLDSLGLHDREEGDMGPMYGFQWRHYGAKYTNMHADYTGQGIDQLRECIRLIKEDPTSRRIVMSAWNVSDMSDMVLNPCHILVQFNVSNGELSCMMFQRSVDCGLGLAFNIASYALLTYIIAHITGLKVGDLIISTGDTHIYLNHVEPLKIQLERDPRPFPKVVIKCEPKDIDDYKFEDFELVDYKPHPTIKMDMAV
jgi:thymidylate synthase